MTDDELRDARVLDLVQDAVAEIVSVKGRGVAQATKTLHLKRPRLVPVIDSFVAGALGARLSTEAPAPTRVVQARGILEHLRHAGVVLRPQLEQVDAHLRSVGIERSLVRILDC